MNEDLLYFNSFKTFSYLENSFMFFPETFLSLCIIYILIKNILLNSDIHHNSVNKFCIISLFISMIIMILINFNSLGFPNLSNLSSIQNNLKIIITMCSIIVLLISKSSNVLDRTNFFNFYILCTISTLGMIIVVTSTNLITLYLALELQMIPIYILCKLNKANNKSYELSIKFFLICFLSSLSIVSGIFLIYEHSSFVYFKDIMFIFETQINNQMSIGFILLLSGIIFKILLPPFHISFPGLFKSVPIPLSLFIATSSFVSFISILLLCTFNFMDADILTWKRTFLILSILSMSIGSLGMFFQKNIKRFIGFFSIVSAGYIFFSITLISSKEIQHILLYLITYIFLLFGLFSTIIILKKDGKSIEYLSDLSGLSSTQPFISLTMLIFLFSMSGIPPFGGFFSKWFLVVSFIQNNNIYIFLTIILSSLLVTISCLKIIKIMYFEYSDFQFNIDHNAHLKFIMLLCLIINFFMFIVISPLIEIITNV